MGADKRGQELARIQETEHRHLLEGHQKEMQALREETKLTLEKCQALSSLHVENLKAFEAKAGQALLTLMEKTIAYEKAIAEHNKAIMDLHVQGLKMQLLYCSLNEMEKVKKDMKEAIHEAGKNNLLLLQNMQAEVKASIASLSQELHESKEKIGKEIGQLASFTEAKLNIAHIDKDGVLNEVRKATNAIFIIEKKIENIYTLIDRINKNRDGASLCHKLD